VAKCAWRTKARVAGPSKDLGPVAICIAKTNLSLQNGPIHGWINLTNDAGLTGVPSYATTTPYFFFLRHEFPSFSETGLAGQEPTTMAAAPSGDPFNADHDFAHAPFHEDKGKALIVGPRI
jgi:hypothetical protein